MIQIINNPKRPSAVSVALKKVNYQASIFAEPKTTVSKSPYEEYKISIANSRESRLQAFQLAYEVYLAKGYIPENKRKMLVSPSDSIPDTCIINIYDKDEAVASITLNFQEHSQLPCQELYSEEISPLLEKRVKLVEITRLVIKENHRHSNFLLAQLFQATFIYAYQIKNISNLVIEVNPRHVAFYQNLLGFTVLGNEKACERVNNAPAILLHLDLNYIQNNLEKFYRNDLIVSNRNKFFKFAMAENIAKSLKVEFKHDHRPISFMERIYFGIRNRNATEFAGVI